jgi:3,4-dihydroxy 2-butanone 4-phosphate synthase/GTP cyclohydrolase II
VAIDPRSTAHDLAAGACVSAAARKGGVLVRAGERRLRSIWRGWHGLVAAGVICEIMNDDGTRARVPDLVKFCEVHGLKMMTVADLIRYRLQNERYIHRVAESQMPTAHGEFRMIAYESEVDGGESHVALVYGDLTGDEPVPVRVHTHCLSGDVFSTTLCDWRALVENSLRMIAEAGKGALVYLHNGSAGFGLDKAVAPARVVFHREQRAREGCEAHRTLRQVGLGGQILSDLGIHKIRLLTNTPTHVPALQGFGIEIVEQIPVSTGPVRR